jgi:hypothetical protein
MNSKESSGVWTEPELIVLVRSKPEEAVLTGCKTGTGNDGYDAVNSRCALLNQGECSASNCISLVTT